MLKPSKEVIAEQIKWLKENKQFIRHFSMFGEDNHRKVEAAIDVLELGMDECEIQEKVDDAAWEEYQRDAAMEALGWLDGDAMSPSDSWKGLVDNSK